MLGAQDHGLKLKLPCTLRAFGNASFHPRASLESRVGRSFVLYVTGFRRTDNRLLLWLKPEALPACYRFSSHHEGLSCLCVGAIGQTLFPQQGQGRHPPSTVFTFPVQCLLQKTSGPCPGNSMPVYLHSAAISGRFAFILV